MTISKFQKTTKRLPMPINFWRVKP